MAKQLVNPIERHVEKGIVGITGLLLIGAIVQYLVTSPNQLELGGEMVTPTTVDRKVASKAADVADRIRRAQVDVDVPEKLLPAFDQSLDPFRHAKLSLTLPRVTPIAPTVPIIDEAGKIEGQRNLVAVAPVGEPVVTQGRSTFLFQTGDGRPLHRPANWVTVSMTFNVKEQMGLQRREYGATRKDVFFGQVELQRRGKRTDGSWADEDWADVDTWPAAKQPEKPPIPMTERGGRLVLAPGARPMIDTFLDRVSEPIMQLDLIRPMMHTIVRGDEWDVPIITSRMDVLRQDNQYLFPNEAPAATPGDRYNPESLRGGPANVNMPAAQRIALEFEAIQLLMKSAKENLAVDLATRAYNKAFEIDQDAAAGASQKRRAKAAMKAASLLEDDINFLAMRRGVRGIQQDDTDNDRPMRQALTSQQLWAHDAGDGSVESGRVYQYRIRPVVLNRLVAQPEKFSNAADADTAFIAGAWSDPIEVTIPPDTEFYFTSKDDRKNEVGVEFYKWVEGVWVKARRFKYKVGEALRGESRVMVPSPDDETRLVNAPVMFEAGSTLLDLDFERSYRERKSGSSRSGVRFGSRATACCVVFTDASGRLHERFVATEKANPGKREAGARVAKAPSGR